MEDAVWMIIAMQIIPKNRNGCDSFKTIQFVRGMKRLNQNMYVPQQKQGGTKFTSRSTPNISNVPDISGWSIDSPVQNPKGTILAAGEPSVDDTPYATTPDVGTPGSLFDTPLVKKNEGFEAYTCLACNTGGTYSIIACLHWGFEARTQDGKLVGKLIPNPSGTCLDKDTRLQKLLPPVIKQWNKYETIKTNFIYQ